MNSELQRKIQEVQQRLKEKGMDPTHDTQIDPDALDVEYATLSNICSIYTKAARDAQTEIDDLKFNLDKLKVKMDEVKADLDLQIRKNPDEFLGGVKVTETAISNVILLHPKYKQAHQKYFDCMEELNTAKYEAGILFGTLEDLKTKANSLNNLTSLLFKEYFMGPSIPRNLVDEIQKFHEKRSEQINDKAKQRMEQVTRRRR